MSPVSVYRRVNEWLRLWAAARRHLPQSQTFRHRTRAERGLSTLVVSPLPRSLPIVSRRLGTPWLRNPSRAPSSVRQKTVAK
jgi:hypothetical protein